VHPKRKGSTNLLADESFSQTLGVCQHRKPRILGVLDGIDLSEQEEESRIRGSMLLVMIRRRDTLLAWDNSCR
jgi:hypothetical protein